MIINLWVCTNGAPWIWLWVVMGLLIGFGCGFGVEFRWWIVVVWWWPGVACIDRRGGSSGYLFCLWVKIEWVCGGDRGTLGVGFGRSVWRCDWL